MAHAPTFASFAPEAALEDFDRSQRREARYALRKLSASVASTGSTPGISREFRIETLELADFDQLAV